MSTLLTQANLLFRNGKYKEAIDLYEKISAPPLVLSIAAFNINLAQTKLARTLGGQAAQSGCAAGTECDLSGDLIQSNYLSLFLEEHHIDCIYVINLEKRFDRKIRTLREFSRLGLNPTFVRGVDANRDADAQKRFNRFLSSEVKNGEFTAHIKLEKLRRIKQAIHLGAFGYNLSHKKIFKDALSKGYKKFCVFDDDIFFTDDFSRVLVATLNAIDPKYKVLMLGASEYSFQDNPNFRDTVTGKSLYHPIPGRTLGSFGAIYDSSVAQEVIDGIDSNLGTFDNVVLGHVFHSYPKDCYVINPNICIPCVEESDIRNASREQAEHSNKMNWDTRNFARYKSEPTFSFIVNSKKQVTELKNLQIDFDKSAIINFFY